MVVHLVGNKAGEISLWRGKRSLGVTPLRPAPFLPHLLTTLLVVATWQSLFQGSKLSLDSGNSGP